MGSEEKGLWREDPIHWVRLDSYFMARYPVTQALWKAVMGEENNPSFFKGDDRPAEQVSWEDARVFFQRLNELTGKVYRLPTEAEWEYAARGGVQVRLDSAGGGNKCEGYRYAGSDKLKEVEWYRANSHQETKAVGQKDPNGLGLYDMTGNVWEWCWDWASDEYYEECHKQGVVLNPQGPKEGVARVFRGGSWYSDPDYCRVSYRDFNRPEDRGDFVGFRLVLSFQFSP